MNSLLSAVLFAGFAYARQTDNFAATFDTQPTLFKIDVNPVFENSLKQRVTNTRYVDDDLGVPAFVDGPSISNATRIGEYWSQKYDWFAHQEDINDR